MMTCKELAQSVKDSIKAQVSGMAAKPLLAIVSVGHDAASAAYVKGTIKDCEEVGIVAAHIQLPENVSQAELEGRIIGVHVASGIILQPPIPKHLSAAAAIAYIDPAKDVDGLGAASPFTPCTARGIFEWLKQATSLEGKNVLIINRSQLVGRPLAKLLLDANATVTVCHSYTKYLHQLLWPHPDIVVTAVGKPWFLRADMCKPDTIIVDVGISRVNGKLHGDVCHDFYLGDKIVTPVPGGVGLLTRAYLLQNVLEAHMKEVHNEH